MAEPAGGQSLSPETGPEERVDGEVGAQALDRDRSPEPSVEPSEDLGHPSSADELVGAISVLRAR
jgi:hypothetical protein